MGLQAEETVWLFMIVFYNVSGLVFEKLLFGNNNKIKQNNIAKQYRHLYLSNESFCMHFFNIQCLETVSIQTNQNRIRNKTVNLKSWFNMNLLWTDTIGLRGCWIPILVKISSAKWKRWSFCYQNCESFLKKEGLLGEIFNLGL